MFNPSNFLGSLHYDTASCYYVVPGTGIEPVRIAPSVFETDASANSAIRALQN